MSSTSTTCKQLWAEASIRSLVLCSSAFSATGVTITKMFDSKCLCRTTPGATGDKFVTMQDENIKRHLTVRLVPGGADRGKSFGRRPSAAVQQVTYIRPQVHRFTFVCWC